MKDTLREQIKAYISLATFKHSTALKDAGFQMDMDAIVDQLLSIIEEEKNKTAGNIYKMGMDIIMEKPASAIVVGGTDLDKLLTQLERKYGKDNIQYAYGDHNEVTEVSK